MPKWTPLKGHVGLYEYNTAKGKRYGARRTYADITGRRREWSTSGKIRWREADQELKQFEADLANGKIGPISNHSITLDQYHERMVARKLALGDWRPSTKRIHMTYYNGHIKKVFGNKKLGAITRSEYQAFLDSLAISTDDKPALARATIRTIDSTVQMTLNEAAREDIIDKNQLANMHLNGNEARSKGHLSDSDAEKWLKTAAKVLDRYELALVLTDTLGLRRGEVMGLRNESITITHDSMNNIDQAALKIDLQRTKDALNGGPLKSKSSYRTVWVFGKMVEELKFAMMTADNLRARKHITSKHHWLWLNAQGEPPYPDHLNHLTRRVSDECDVWIYPHLLRHYFATKAAEKQKSQIGLMHYLGHKNLQMTADYSRDTKESSLAVFDAMSDFLDSL